MSIGPGKYVDSDFAWSAARGVSLLGSTQDAAEIRGGDLSIIGDLAASGLGRIDAKVTVSGFATNITVPKSGDQITFAKDVARQAGDLFGVRR